MAECIDKEKNICSIAIGEYFQWRTWRVFSWLYISLCNFETVLHLWLHWKVSKRAYKEDEVDFKSIGIGSVDFELCCFEIEQNFRTFHFSGYSLFAQYSVTKICIYYRIRIVNIFHVYIFSRKVNAEVSVLFC